MKLRGLAGTAAVILMTAGCLQQPDGSTPNIFSDVGLVARSPGSEAGGASPEQQALREQATRYRDYAKTRLQGAAAGAVVGGIVGTLLDRNNRARGALLGATAGAAVGYVGGSYLTRNHAEFVASRESLDKDIQVANDLSSQSQENVQLAQAALDYQRTEIARLNEEFQAGQASAEDYERELAGIAEDHESVQSMIAATEERVDRMETSIAAYRQAGLDTAQLVQANAVQTRDLENLRRIEDAMVELISGAPEGVARPTVA